MEIFTGLRASALLIRPSPLRKYRALKDLSEARAAEFMDINTLYEALDQVRKEVKDTNVKHHTRTHERNNADQRAAAEYQQWRLRADTYPCEERS